MGFITIGGQRVHTSCIGLLGNIPLYDNTTFEVENRNGITRVTYSPERRQKGLANYKGYIPCPAPKYKKRR